MISNLLETIKREEEDKKLSPKNKDIKYHITDNVISLSLVNREELIISKKLRPEIFNNLKESLINNKEEVTKQIIKELSYKNWIKELSYILEEDEEGKIKIKGRVIQPEESYIITKIHSMIRDNYGIWGIKPLLCFYNNVEKNKDPNIKRNIYKAFINNKDFCITNEGYIIAYRRAKWQIQLMEEINFDTEILGWNKDIKFKKIYKSKNNNDCILGSFNAVTESYFCLDEGMIYENVVNPEHINKFVILNKKNNSEETGFYLKTKEFFPIGEMETIVKEDSKIWNIDLKYEDRNHYLIRTPYNKESAIKELTNLLKYGEIERKNLEERSILSSNC